jgi:hypothetical protein
MTEQKTIIPETTGERIVKGLKRQSKESKTMVELLLLLILLASGCAVGYSMGYHQALLDFNIIAGKVIIL